MSAIFILQSMASTSCVVVLYNFFFKYTVHEEHVVDQRLSSYAYTVCIDWIELEWLDQLMAGLDDSVCGKLRSNRPPV